MSVRTELGSQAMNDLDAFLCQVLLSKAQNVNFQESAFRTVFLALMQNV